MQKQKEKMQKLLSKEDDEAQASRRERSPSGRRRRGTQQGGAGNNQQGKGGGGGVLGGVLGNLRSKVGLGGGSSNAHTGHHRRSGRDHHRAAVEEGWFVNTVDTVGSGITSTIYNAYVFNKPTLVHDAKGIKLGDERFYNDVRFNFTTEHFIRKGIILLITNPLYKFLFCILTIVHTISLMVQEPIGRKETDSADDSIGWAIVVDRFLLFFYGLDMGMRIVAHGFSLFILNVFRVIDVVVFASMLGLEFASTETGILPYFLALNALRPFRMVSQIRTMKNIVTVVVRTSTTLVDVLVLLSFLVGVFGVFSLTIFGPALRSRCYLTDSGVAAALSSSINWTSLTPLVMGTLGGGNMSWADGYESFSLRTFYSRVPEDVPDDRYSSFCRVGSEHSGLGGLYTPCRDNEECRANAPAAYTWGGFDNMVASLLTTIQVMTLENWSQIALDVMDACTPISSIFFLVLTMVGSFWAMNLVLATITKSFETFYEEDRVLAEEEEREREKARQLTTETRRSIFLPFIMGDKDKKENSSDSDGSEGDTLTAALLQRQFDGPDGVLADTFFPNEDAGSVAAVSKTKSARLMSSMTDTQRQYVLDLEKGDPLMPLGGGAGDEEDTEATSRGRRLRLASKRMRGMFNMVGGKMKGLVHQTGKGIGGLLHLKDEKVQTSGFFGGPSTYRRDDHVRPTATSPPDTNPYLANPYLRSRWRLMVNEMSRQSVASMALLTSVPVDKIAEHVMEERKLQRLSVANKEGRGGENDQRYRDDEGIGNNDTSDANGRTEIDDKNDDDDDEEDATYNPLLARIRNRDSDKKSLPSNNGNGSGYRYPTHYNPAFEPRTDAFYAQRRMQARFGTARNGFVDHTKGLDELLRDAAEGIEGTTRIVEGVGKLSSSSDGGDMNAVVSSVRGRSGNAYSVLRLKSDGRVMRRTADEANEDDDDGAIELHADPFMLPDDSQRRNMSGTFRNMHSDADASSDDSDFAALQRSDREKRKHSKGPSFSDGDWPVDGNTPSRAQASSAMISIPYTPSPSRGGVQTERRKSDSTSASEEEFSYPSYSPLKQDRFQPVSSRKKGYVPPAVMTSSFSAMRPKRGWHLSVNTDFSDFNANDRSDFNSSNLLANGVVNTSGKVLDPSSPISIITSLSPTKSALADKRKKDGAGPGWKRALGDVDGNFFGAGGAEKGATKTKTVKIVVAKDAPSAALKDFHDASSDGSSSPQNTHSDAGSLTEIADGSCEAASLRLHTYYDDRLFDGEKVRKQFRDYVPRPVYDASKANGLLRLSVDVDEKQQKAFDTFNRKFRYIMEWRSQLDFDESCAADQRIWQAEEGNPVPMTIVDASPIELGVVAESDSLDATSSDEDGFGRGGDADSLGSNDSSVVSSARHRRRNNRRRAEKKRKRRNKPNSASNGNGDGSHGGSNNSENDMDDNGEDDDEDDVSSLDSISTTDHIEPIDLQAKADKIFHIHRQYLHQATTMLAERKQELARKAAKGVTTYDSEQDAEDEKKLTAIQNEVKDRMDRKLQHQLRVPKDKVLTRIGRRRTTFSRNTKFGAASGPPTNAEITEALQTRAEVDARDGGLFAKITLTAQLRAEIKFLEQFIARELARKTNSTQDVTTRRVRMEAKRGFKIHEKRAKTLKGNLLLIMLGDWYSGVCKGAVLFNTVLLLFVHYDQPIWLTVIIELVSYMVDLLLIFDCLVRVWLWSPRKYFTLTTSHFFAFVEHIVVWFALLDLFAFAMPAIRVVRVFRVFRFVSSFSAVRRIVKTVQSSIRHLMHIVGFLAIFMMMFTVGGWQIFSSADLTSGYPTCKHIVDDQYKCDSTPNCVWVSREQWRTLTNIEFDQMKEMSVKRFEEEESKREKGGESSSSISRTIFYTEAEGPFLCRQYQGWGEVDAGMRFNFGTLFSSFSTVFTVVTKDAWTDITFNYMQNVTPFSAIFFLCILFIGGFVLVPLLVAILLVNFEENNEGDAAESRDAALLDEVRRQLNELGPENQLIAEQLRLREEKDNEKKRLEALQEEAKAAAKAANVAAAEEARRRDLETQRERARVRAEERKREVEEEAARKKAEEDKREGGDGGSAAAVDRSYWLILCDDLKDTFARTQRGFRETIAYLSTTLIFRFCRAIFRYVASFCDRRDAMPEKILGRSLMVLPANNPFRLFCCDVVGGRYIKFELCTFWLSVLHCVVTPLIDNSVEDLALRDFVRVINGTCVALSVIDMFIRCVAQCAILGTYAFTRVNVLNKADFFAVICSLAASAPELLPVVPNVARPYLWALSGFRPLRVVVRSSSVIKVLEAIWFAVPDMLNVIGVFVGASLLFAVIGVEQLKGMLKTCQDGSDRSEVECVGYWVAKEGDGVYLDANHTGILMERAWKNPRQSNFDNSYSAIATLMEVCVASQWGEVLFTIIDTPNVAGGAPERNQNEVRSIYLFIWLVLSNFVLMNIFVGTVVNSFRKYRSLQSESFFGTETTETRAVKQILEGTTAKKRLTPSEIPFISASLNHFCNAIVKRWWWRRFGQFVLFANCAMMLTIHSDQSFAFEVAQFAISNVCAFFFFCEMLIKMCIAGPRMYLGMGFNQIQFVVVVLAVVELILFLSYAEIEDIEWFRVSWTVRVIALAKEAPSVRRLVRVGVRSLPAMGNIGSLLLLLFYVFSIWGIAMFKDVRIIPAGRDSLNQNLNFRTFPRAMFTLYRVATLDDWGDIVAFSGPSEPYCSKELGTCGNRTLARFFFTFFVVSIAFVMLNLFIAVVLESFELSELIPDTLREREEDVQRFRQAWGKMATGNHLKIHARDFVPLLKELPGPRARLQMLLNKQADDPDFQMTEEEMNYIAKKHAFGLQGEEPQTYIKSLVYLNVPIIMPTQEVLFKDTLDVISRLLFNDYLTSESAAEIEDAVMAERPSEYKDGFTVAHYYCANRISTLLGTRKGTKLQYPKWSRFLDPIFREIYERNSTAVIGGNSGDGKSGGATGKGEKEKDKEGGKVGKDGGKEGSSSNAASGGKDGTGGNKSSAISTKKYSLADYLREALKNNKYTEDDDTRWKGAIRECVSEGSESDDSEGSDYCLPDSYRALKQKDDSAKAREAIRTRMRLTGENYFGTMAAAEMDTSRGLPTSAIASRGGALPPSILQRGVSASPTEAQRLAAAAGADGDGTACAEMFMPLEDRMVLLQGRQDDGYQLASRHNRLTGGTTQLPTLDEVIARRARQKQKAQEGLLSAGLVGGGGLSSSATAVALGKARIRKLPQQDAIPPYIWRRQINYDNSVVIGRKAPAMSFIAAVTEASKAARTGRLSAANRANAATTGNANGATVHHRSDGYKSSLPPELKARIKSALLQFARDYKESQKDEALILRPVAVDDDATDAKVKLPSLDELVRKIRREKGLPPDDIGTIIANRQHLVLSEAERGASAMRYGMRIDDVQPGPPGSAFGLKGSTCISIPLPFSREGAGANAASTSDANSRGSGGVISGAASAMSSRNNWTGGTTRGGKRKQQQVVIEPGATQHELDRLLGILALKKFARKWREKAAAKKTEREKAQAASDDPNNDPNL